MILRCADRPYRAWTDESKETLRRSCRLSPQQRRESRHSGTAALGQFPTHAPQQTAPLVDRIASAGDESWWDREAEGSPRFEVDGKIVVRAACTSTMAASVVDL